MKPRHGQALQAQKGSQPLGIRRNSVWIYHRLGNELLLFSNIKGEWRIRRVLHHADRYFDRFAPAHYCPICMARLDKPHNSLECNGHQHGKLRPVRQTLRGWDRARGRA